MVANASPRRRFDSYAAPEVLVQRRIRNSQPVNQGGATSLNQDVAPVCRKLSCAIEVGLFHGFHSDSP
jgi:hypothetical protein